MSLITKRRPTSAWLVAGGMALGLLSACSRTEAPPEPVRAVKLLQVQSATAQLQRQYAAQVQARTEVAMAFQVGGRLLERSVQLGEQVAAGQLLARIEAQDYALGVQAAQAAVQAARTQRDLAQADWQRFSALEKEGFISPVELDRRRASLEAAQAQLQQAQAQAASQGNQQAYTRLSAPEAGVVTAVLAEPGQVLGAGAPVLRLALDGGRDAIFVVPEDGRSQVTPGQQVLLRPWSDGPSYTAQVRELAASADPVTRTYMVKASINAAAQQALPPLGSTLQAQIVQTQPPSLEQPLLRLPSPALWQQADGRSAVWVFDAQQSQVHAQQVEVAGTEGSDVLIASGLEAGQQVVAAGVHVLSEGQTVTVYQP